MLYQNMRLTNSRRTHAEGQERAKDTNLPLTLHQLWTGRGYLGNEAEFEKRPGGPTRMGEIQDAPKKEPPVVKISKVRNLYKYDEFTNNYINKTPHKSSSRLTHVFVTLCARVFVKQGLTKHLRDIACAQCYANAYLSDKS